MQNGFKVKRQTIPKSKFTGTGSGDQATTFRCPCQRKDRTSHLVGGGFDETRRDGVARVIHVARRWHQIGNVTVLRLESSSVAIVALPNAILKIKKKISEREFWGETNYASSHFQSLNNRRIVIDSLSHHTLTQSLSIEVVLYLHASMLVRFVERLVVKVVILMEIWSRVKIWWRLKVRWWHVRRRKIHHELEIKMFSLLLVQNAI